jgi:hypothetical protein
MEISGEIKKPVRIRMSDKEVGSSLDLAEDDGSCKSEVRTEEEAKTAIIDLIDDSDFLPTPEIEKSEEPQ